MSLTLPLALLFGYALGSIPFGVILTRLTGAGDLRAIGSGNIGATNVLRTGRKGLAAATLLGDMLKGTVAVLLAFWLWPGTAAPVVAGVGAFLGHVFPVWLRFRGGKGVATFLGVLLGLSWPLALGFAVVWLITAWLSRYSSLSALVAAALMVLAGFAVLERPAALAIAALAALLIAFHRENIARLRDGTETRIGEKRAAAGPAGG